MKWPDFTDPKYFYVVICFVEAQDLESEKQHLEVLGKQNNIRLIVQPCPFEVLEFLYRLDADLLSHQSSYDAHIFCKALTLGEKVSKNIIDQITDHYHAYFLALIDQNDKEVRAHAQALQNLAPHFASQVSEKEA